jgi:cytochrome c553
MKIVIPFIVVLSLSGVAAVSLTALAQPPTQPAASGPAPATPASLGQQIATHGTRAGAPACASCHGAQGEGNANSGFPRIAGQPAQYLTRQLDAFASGQRRNPAMAKIAQAMTQQQRQAVSAYYAALIAPAAKSPAPQGANAGRGAALATVGDNRQRVQACANCHGPGGIGEAPTYPYLAGQNSNFLVAALNEWKNGARRTDPSGQMEMIGRLLNTNDIAALAVYYSQQTPPPPAGAATVTPPSRAPAGQGGIARPTGPGGTAQTGTGAEQGAGITGGQQGPGGGGGGSGSGPSGSQTGAAPG